MTKNVIDFPLNKKNNDNPFLTKADHQWLDFSEAVLDLLNNPEKAFNDDIINRISSYEIKNKCELDFRLKAAQKVLSLQSKTPLNQLLIATLQDYEKLLTVPCDELEGK